MLFQTEKTALLIEHLQEKFPDSSKNTLKSWVKFGRIYVGRRKAQRWNESIPSGEMISLKKKESPDKDPITYLYQDRDIVVVDKPSGLVTVATNDEKEVSLHKLLKQKFKPATVHVVHRIDKETSGVVLFALSIKGREKLKEMFEKKALDRVYLAVVEGKLQQKKGTWKSRLFETSSFLVKSTDHPDVGKLAVTHYEVVKEGKDYSLLQFKLETGRKNQIRVHCQDAGHSIAGDKKYGAKTDPVRRLCLHAKTLAFKHPITNQPLLFESPTPLPFNQVCRWKDA